jgi:branched-chain amino acid transport system substrate-binding protein
LSRRRPALAPVAALALSLVAASCGGDEERRGTEPVEGARLTIVSSLPSDGPEAGAARAIQAGIAAALEERRGRVGRWSVRHRAFDASLGRGDGADEGRSRRNARRTIADPTAVAYIGEMDSLFSKVTVPFLNDAGIAQVGPTNTHVGLTAGGAGAEAGEPGKYYPAEVRSYARIVPDDRVQGAALAQGARDAGCRGVRIWRSNTAAGQGLAELVRRAARRIGLPVSGTEEIKPQQPSYLSAAEKIGSDCLVWTGEPERSGVQILGDAAEGTDDVALLASYAHCTAGALDVRGGLSPAALGRLRCTSPIVPSRDPLAARVLSLAGSRDPHVLYGYEAMALLLDAVERAGRDGSVSRADVVDELLGSSRPRSALGPYRISDSGDTDRRAFGIFRAERGRLVLDEVVEPQG